MPLGRTIVSFVITVGLVASTRAEDSTDDLTRSLSPDAVFVVRADSMDRVRRDFEQLANKVNPFYGALVSGALTGLESDPIYKAIDTRRPVAVASFSPGTYEGGGLVLLIPTRDSEKFAAAYKDRAPDEMRLVSRDGWVLLVSDGRLTEEAVLAEKPWMQSDFDGTLTGVVRVQRLKKFLSDRVDEILTGLGGGGESPSQVVRAARRFAGILEVLAGEAERVDLELDLTEAGVRIRKRVTPVSGSQLAAFLQLQNVPEGTYRIPGAASDFFHASGSIDWKPILPRLASFLNGHGADAAWAKQVLSLVEKLDGEFGLSVGFDRDTGFRASEVFGISDERAVRETLGEFAANPEWLRMAFSSSSPFRFELSPEPSPIDGVPVQDYRLVEGDEKEMPGILVAATGKHLLLTLGKDRRERMKDHVTELRTRGSFGDAHAAESFFGIPKRNNLRVRFSMIDYMIAGFSALGESRIPFDLGNEPLTGNGQVGAYLSFDSGRLDAGFSMPAQSIREITEFGQKQLFARMANPTPTRRVTASEPPVSPDSLEAMLGKEAHDFKLPSLDGAAVSLSGFRGKVVVINFFATWCPPCHLEVPRLVEVGARLKDRGLVVLLVSNEERETIARFTNDHKVKGSVLRQRAGEKLPAPYDRIITVPKTLILDRSGVLVEILSQLPDAAELSKKIEKLL